MASASTIGVVAALFGERLDSVVAEGVGIAVVAAGALLFGVAMIFGLRTIRCPRCSEGWLQYALRELPFGSNFMGWLYSFKSCPKCGATAKDLKSGCAV